MKDINLTRSPRGFSISENRVHKDGVKFTHHLSLSLGLEAAVQEYNKIGNKKIEIISQETEVSVLKIGDELVKI